MKIAALLVAAFALTATAAGFRVQSYFSEAWDKHSLEVTVAEPGAKLWLNLPARSGVSVSVRADTGAAVTSCMSMAGGLNLKGTGRFRIDIVRDSGAGQWTCSNLSGSPVLTRVTSRVSPERGARLVITPETDEEYWTFSAPREATFLVRHVNSAGKTVEEQDLSDSDEVELIGGGSFTLDVVSADGEGDFTAQKK